jgi:type I restriction enzyme, S subunit
MKAAQLLTHFRRISEAPDAIPRLRRFILELAVRGKLVEQNPRDEPASELLKRIQTGNRQLENANDPLAEGEQSFKIPQSWAWIRIGSAAHVEMGQSPPSENYNQSGDGIPFYQGKTDFGLRYPTPRYWCTTPSKLAQKDDILISVRAPVGPTNVASEECCIGRGLAALRPRHDISLEFLLYSLKGFESSIAAMGYGTTFVAITKKQLISFAVPLPPLAEQHRIVAKVDDLMALCDRLEAAKMERESRRDRVATASLNRLNQPVDDPFQNHTRFYFNHLSRLTTRPEHIKQLRQTILNLAVSGKLVPQDPNDEPASELLKRIRTEKARLVKAGILAQQKVKFSEAKGLAFNCPMSWQAVDFRDVCNLVTSGSRGWAEFYSDTGPKFIRAQNVRFGRLRLEDLACVSLPKKAEGTRTQVSKGDLLIVITGAGVTNPALLDHELGEAYVSQHVALIKPTTKSLSRWLLLCLMAPVGARAELVQCAYGAGKPGLNLDNIRSLRIPLPPLAEQHRIVAKVEELMALCHLLEAQLTTTQTESRRLLETALHETLAGGAGETNEI